MGADALASAGLQSGFVIAVVIAAVLLADRLGGGRVLTQRVAQVALGVALAMLVFSATAAFNAAPDIPLSEFDAMFDSDEQLLEAGSESAERNSEVGTIHVGLGLIFVAIGVVLFRKLTSITPALLLGGVLLILLGAPSPGLESSPFIAVFGLLPGSSSDAGNVREIARFVVLLVGVVLLTGAIHWRWERGGPDEAGDG